MKIKVKLGHPKTWPKGLIIAAHLDATTEGELAVQQGNDDASAIEKAAKYVRLVLQGLDSKQQCLSKRVTAVLEIIRNWQQGKSIPKAC